MAVKYTGNQYCIDSEIKASVFDRKFGLYESRMFTFFIFGDRKNPIT